jgi:hypothetical protein
MISTTPKPGDRLRAHANDLRSGRLRWVPRPPGVGEACLVLAREPDGFAIGFLDDAYQALRVVTCTPKRLLSDWNDTHTLPEVISALEAAADLLDKEGE